VTRAAKSSTLTMEKTLPSRTQRSASEGSIFVVVRNYGRGQGCRRSSENGDEQWAITSELEVCGDLADFRLCHDVDGRTSQSILMYKRSRPSYP
jgi:hypothetical protein